MNDTEKITRLARLLRNDLYYLDNIQKEVAQILALFNAPVRKELDSFIKEFDFHISDARTTLSGLASTAIQNWPELSSLPEREVGYE